MALVFAGIVCLFLCGLTLYMSLPRESKPESAWTRTETRATGTALLLLIMLMSGATLVVKGLLS